MCNPVVHDNMDSSLEEVVSALLLSVPRKDVLHHSRHPYECPCPYGPARERGRRWTRPFPGKDVDELTSLPLIVLIGNSTSDPLPFPCPLFTPHRNFPTSV